jgi:hypothetical protein
MKNVALAAFAALVVSAPVAAQVTTYTDVSAFNAATTGRTTYGIAAPASGTYQSTGGSYTVGGLTVNSTDQFLEGDGAYGADPYLNNINTQGGGVFVFTTLSGSHTALGFDLGAYGASGTVNVTINGVTGYSFVAQSNPGGGFFGITSVDAISTVNFSSLSFGELDMVHITVGELSAAPEPASWALMLTGFGAVGMGLRRRRTTALA